MSRPGDRQEREADRVAEAVMRAPVPAGAERGPDRGATPSALAPRVLQRSCACGAEPGRGGGCEKCSSTSASVQLARTESHPGSAQQPEAPAIVHDALRTPGQPLDPDTRAFMEPRFGFDFSRVRVHTDALATESARAVNARAYTVGPHIAFASGQYTPGSGSSRRLLAHELAHVVQQDGGEPASLQRAPVEGEEGAPAEATPGDIVDSSVDVDPDSGRMIISIDGVPVVEAQLPANRSSGAKVETRLDATGRLDIRVVLSPGIDYATLPEGLGELGRRYSNIDFSATNIPAFESIVVLPEQPEGLRPVERFPLEVEPRAPAPLPVEEQPRAPEPRRAPEPAPPPAPTPAATSGGLWDDIGEWVHGALDVVGVIPGVGEIADGINAAIYLAEGRYAEAAVSAVGMIPVLGDIGKAGKWSVKVGREVGEEAVERAGRRAGREIAEAGAERAGREAAEAGGERAGREVAEAGGRAERQEAKAAAKAEKEEAAGAAKQKGSKKEKKKGEKGKWGCRDVRCNVYPDPQADPQNPNCPKRVIGATPYIHPSYNVACVAAQKDANDKVPRGCIKRHCNCRTKCTKK